MNIDLDTQISADGLRRPRGSTRDTTDLTDAEEVLAGLRHWGTDTSDGSGATDAEVAAVVAAEAAARSSAIAAAVASIDDEKMHKPAVNDSVSATPFTKQLPYSVFSPVAPYDHTVLFRQADIGTLYDIERFGGRRTEGLTSAYGSATKLAVMGGPSHQSPSIGFATAPANAGVTIPIDGLLSPDEWTVTFRLGNFHGVEFVDANYPAGQYLLRMGGQANDPNGGGFVLYRGPANVITCFHYGIAQGVSLTIPNPSWASGIWKSITIAFRNSPAVFEMWLDNNYAGRATTAVQTTPMTTVPYSGPNENGILFGGGANGHSFYISDLVIYRNYRPHSTTTRLSVTGPVLTVNPSSTAGAWREGLGGVFGIYHHYANPYPTAPNKAIRDKQFDLVFRDAGVRVVRRQGLMNMIGITGTAPNYVYDFVGLDEHLDKITSYPNVKMLLGLDFTPVILQPNPGEVKAETDPPTSNANFATIASALVGHLVARYPTQILGFSGWNEPDGADFWTGTDAAHYALWKAVQTKLIADHPTWTMGTPEFSGAAGAYDFLNLLGLESAGFKSSVKAVSLHTIFTHDPTTQVNNLLGVRLAAVFHGLSATIPIWVGEHSVGVSTIGELLDSTTAESWWKLQPNPLLTSYQPANSFAVVAEMLKAYPYLGLTAFSCLGVMEYGAGLTGAVTTGTNPKGMPALGFLTVMAKLGGTKVAATSNYPWLRGLASKNGSTITLSYGAYRPWRGYVERLPFEIDWQNLPSTFSWRHWQQDFTTDHKLTLVGAGDQTDLPSNVAIGGLGVGCFELVE